MSEHTMHIAAYVHVSTGDQNEQRQMRAIREKYTESEQDTEIDWYCDLGESGASTSRREYQRLREHVAEYDVVVAHELDRLGRSFADLAGFIEDLREMGIDIDLVNQPIGTVGEDGRVSEPAATFWGGGFVCIVSNPFDSPDSSFGEAGDCCLHNYRSPASAPSF